MLPYLYYNMVAWVKKYELHKKYNAQKNFLILNHPELIPFITIIEIIVRVVWISIQFYLLYLGILVFITFILFIIYLVTGYEFWE